MRKKDGFVCQTYAWDKVIVLFDVLQVYEGPVLAHVDPYICDDAILLLENEAHLSIYGAIIQNLDLSISINLTNFIEIRWLGITFLECEHRRVNS